MRDSFAASFFYTSHAGVGLKPRHVEQILSTRPDIGFFEVHAENYMGAGGAPHRHLTAIRESYPLSVHGVGLSLGGAEELNEQHLARLRDLVCRYEPVLVSEHLAWASHAHHFLNDLLPVPYTLPVLERVAGNVDRVQNTLGRQILLENPSTYLGFEESVLAENEFIAELAARTGCGLLLDVNNVQVASVNHGLDPRDYLAAFPLHRVKEIHLAGHASRVDGGGRRLLVDSHDEPVSEAVWALYGEVIARVGPIPTLIERDANIPPWEELHAEAQRAQGYFSTRASGVVHAIAC